MRALATSPLSPSEEVAALGFAAKGFVIALARHALLERTRRLEFVVDGGATLDLKTAFDRLLLEAWPDLIGEPPACELFWPDEAAECLGIIDIRALDKRGRLLFRQEYSASNPASEARLTDAR